MSSEAHNKRGMALIYVLWIVILLTAIAFKMTYRGHLRAQVTATTGGTIKAHYLARAGIEMAIADLAENYQSASEQHRMRGESELHYKNVVLGGGAYTLFARMDSTNNMIFGLMDECAKLNINKAGAAMLERLPMMENGLAHAIIALRKEEELYDLNSLLLIEGVDVLQLYGEDQNGNGLLDANENDGRQNWPPDNADGKLDRGLYEYLTTWSAAKDVNAEGDARINLNDDDAEEIAGAHEEISMQQADSIVHHRSSNEFSSVLDLLEVKLIEKVKKTGNAEEQKNQKDPKNNQPKPPNQNQTAQATQSSPQKPDDKKDPQEASKEKEEEKKEKKEKKKDDSQYEIKETGKKAFTQEDVLKIADLLTVHEDDALPGLININTAPFEVLACLPGVDEAMAQAIENEADNRPDAFLSATDLLEVQGMDMKVLKGIYNLISVRSDVYTARSFGVLDNLTTVACVSAVLDRSDSEVVIRYWREHD